MVLAGSSVRAENPFQQAIRTTSPSVVKISQVTRALFSKAKRRPVASGVILTRDGDIVTCASTLSGSGRIYITLPDGTTHGAQIIRRDKEADLALLHLERRGLRPIRMHPGGLPKVGQWVVTVGNPFALARTHTDPLSASVGVVSAVRPVRGRRFAYKGPVILSDIIVNPVASGSAMVDLNGRLVGICGPLITSTRTNTQISFAIPVSAVRKLLEEDDTTDTDTDTTAPPPKASDTGYLGAYILDEDDATTGAYIQRVVPGSPAARAGLKDADVVTRLDDKPTPNGRRLIECLDVLKPSTRVKLTIVRKGTETTTSVTLGRAPRQVLK